MRAFCNLMIFSILDNLCIGTVIFTSVFLEVWPFYYPHPLLCSSPTVYQVCSLETLTASWGARGGLCVCVCVCVCVWLMLWKRLYLEERTFAKEKT